MSDILRVKHLVQEFPLTKKLLDKYKFHNWRLVKEEKKVHAVNGISFHIKKGEVFSLVGESGCGKSTVARTVMLLYQPVSGTVAFDGQRIEHLNRKELLPFRRQMQMIFQDPYASLNPRYRVSEILAEPMRYHKLAKSAEEAKDMTVDLLEKVGLRPEQANRYPHQFSGGQRQRIGIARALAVNPQLIIADEPVSALDVSIQAQIINLLIDLKKVLKLSYLFIAHDLSVVKHISDRIGVMYLGKIVEVAEKNTLFRNPVHPYTRLLISSVLTIEEEPLLKPEEVGGEIPSPIQLPNGCFFHNRCPYAVEKCFKEYPQQVEIEPNHYVSCHVFPGDKG